jgi:hypothetical protein
MVTTFKYTRFAIMILSLGTVIGTTELASAEIQHPPGIRGIRGVRPIGIRPPGIRGIRPIGVRPIGVRPPGTPGPIGIPAPGNQTQQ